MTMARFVPDAGRASANQGLRRPSGGFRPPQGPPPPTQAPSRQYPPAENEHPPTHLDFNALVRKIEDWIQSNQDVDGFSHNMEWSRVHLLRKACVNSDYFFLVLHQIFCLVPTPFSLFSQGNLPAIKKAFDILESTMRKNSQMSSGFVTWFATFPDYFESLIRVNQYYKFALSRMEGFLVQLATEFFRLTDLCVARRYPFTVDEMERVLGCPSPTLQTIFFTACRRRVGFADNTVGGKMDAVHAKDQEFHRKMASRPLTAEERAMWEVRIAGEYRAISAEVFPPIPQPQAQPQAQPVVSSSSSSSPPPAGFFQLPASGQMGSGPYQVANAFSQPPVVPSTTQQLLSPTGQQPLYPPQGQLQYPPMPTPQDQQQLMQPLQQVQPPSLPAQYEQQLQQHRQQQFQQVSQVPQNPQIEQQPTLQQQFQQLQNQQAQHQQLQQRANHQQHQLQQQQQFLRQQHFQHHQLQQQQLHQQQQHQHQQHQHQQQLHPQLLPRQSPLQPNLPLPMQHSPLGQWAVTGSGASPTILAPRVAITRPRNASVGHGPSSTTPLASPGPSPFLSFGPIAQMAQPPWPPQPQGPATQQPMAPRDALLPPRGYVIPQKEWPTQVWDEKSTWMSLHQAHVRSPRRQAKALPAGAERFYQAVKSLAAGPVPVPPLDELQEISFEVTEEQLALAAVAKMRNRDHLPTVECHSGSLRWRLRCCRFDQGAWLANSTVGDWLSLEVHWPPSLFMLFNDMHALETRRHTHNKKDLPIELTDFVTRGTNRVKISLPEVLGVKSANRFFAVEMLEVLSHSHVVQRVWDQGVIPEDETLQIVRKRLSGPADDDGVLFEAPYVSIDLADPFMSRIFSVPVRGVECRHLECFDLDTWLQTRPVKPGLKCRHHLAACDCPAPAEPSVPDKWACPVCGKDARPCSLRIDGFLLMVRRQLEAQGRLNTKSVHVKADGTWTVVVEDDDDGDMDDDGPARRSAGTRSTSAAPVAAPRREVEIIEID
ncbi:hypothetical protein B0T18DRAFT_51480 [Schizothecium vesticola]|uniref:SP-RING-type domain-containing protein n=1 Tax=Schizothecium vesticola TaxID=314040 RepID=A0AA40FC34_9PEZI|nr:hypothetical protein B0T18DRAFT_51480 [Schizothecium vesticola]